MKQTSSMPDYEQLSEALENTALKMHPSQVHGLICGLLSGNPQTTSTWEELVASGAEQATMHDLLDAMFEITANQLNEFLFELEMVLPSDDVALPLRAEALTLWCQGFLTGLKMAQVEIEDRKPSEFTEAINDIIEIAKMNYEEVVASEEDEEAYTELVEFVRMAVILIYQDLREQDAPKKSNASANQMH